MNHQTTFIAEVSSNHHQNIQRCFDFIETAANIGCDAVKFQLFRLEELFAPEVLNASAEHQRRKAWELPTSFIPKLRAHCDANDIAFCCTPFYLQAVDELAPYVHSLKIASYELLWDDLLIACANTGLPIILSTGMANFDEIDKAVRVLNEYNAPDVTLLHCVSAYPTPENECNLSVIRNFKERYGCKAGWSDHSKATSVLNRAIHYWQADCVEFHMDLDQQGAEYGAGHCWLPEEIAPIIQAYKRSNILDGNPNKTYSASEAPDRDWRADPSDGLRPLKKIRSTFGKEN